MRKWILLLVMFPVWFQEVGYWGLLGWGDWLTVMTSEPPYRVVDGSQGGVLWSAAGGGSGSGGDWCYLNVEVQNGELLWSSGQNIGTSWVRRDRDADVPRFLVYQPVLGATTNYRLLENPHLIQPGIWLIEPGPAGYEKKPVVTNPVSLVVRNPVGVAVLFFCLLFILLVFSLCDSCECPTSVSTPTRHFES